MSGNTTLADSFKLDYQRIAPTATGQKVLQSLRNESAYHSLDFSETICDPSFQGPKSVRNAGLCNSLAGLGEGIEGNSQYDDNADNDLLDVG